MTRFIAVVSGKGGVGKTTTALNLGVALRNMGKDVILVDGSLTTPDVGLRLGATNVPVTLHDVLSKNKSILESIYQHSSGLKVIPGDIGLEALNNSHSKKMKDVMKKLQGHSEIVLIDVGAGLSKENMALMDAADEILVITNPEIAAVTDALKSIKLAEGKEKLVLGVVLNKANDLEMPVENIEAMLDRPVISVIPESDDIKKSNLEKQPAVFLNPGSKLTEEYNKLALMLLGE